MVNPVIEFVELEYRIGVVGGGEREVRLPEEMGGVGLNYQAGTFFFPC